MTTVRSAVPSSVIAEAMRAWTKVTATVVGAASPAIDTVRAFATSVSAPFSGTANADRTNPTTSRGTSCLTL
ncbi:hypothetical protein ACVMYR_32395 [Micromonospora sp. PTRAS2]